MSTFDVIVDLATLIGPGATETSGEVTFSPRLPRHAKWTTDGDRITNTKPVTETLSIDNGPQTFPLAHPGGWLVPFGWHVKVTCGSEQVVSQNIHIPEPGTSNRLPDLLALPVVLPDGTQAAMLKGDPGPANTLSVGTVAVGEPSVSITGESPNQTLNIVMPVAEGSAPDLSGYVQTTDSRLSDARTPLGHSHPTDEVTGLQELLEQYQPAGSYAPLSHPHTLSDITDYEAPQQPPTASLGVSGHLQAVYINTGDALPADTPPWALVIEVDPQ